MDEEDRVKRMQAHRQASTAQRKLDSPMDEKTCHLESGFGYDQR